MNSTVTLNQFKNIFNYLLDNNFKLINNGKSPIAIGIRGDAGLGKTSLVQQVADERGMTLCKLSLAQLEEVGDICGFPVKEYKVVNPEGVRWLSADVLHTIQCDTCEVTGEHRMGYAPPAWLPREENPNGVILFLDDFSRANQLILQAVMELINCGTYMSWKLPKNTIIVLSENPDNGMFQVNSMDVAMRTRYVSFDVEFNLNDWAAWAETDQIDGRAINFALAYGHEIFNKKNALNCVNPRSYVTFCRAISSLENWEDADSLSLIHQIAKGCFDDENNTIGNLFTLFINNKLDKLISPEDILLKPWDKVKPRLMKSIYDKNNKFRQDIAAILSLRMLNYSSVHLNNGNNANAIQDRLIELIESEEKIFTDDLLFNIIKNLVRNYANKCSKLLRNEKILSKVI